MNRVLLLLAVLCFPSVLFPQDIRVREQAVNLLEKANAVSTAVHLPNLERTDTFQVFGNEAGTREGTFTRVVIQGTGRRDETTFGDYHVIEVHTGRTIAKVRSHELAPPEVEDLMRLTPIYHLNFDDQDVIHRIDNREVNGRAARCIEFDTITGQKSEANEICVDAENGTLLREKVDDELVENSEFFSFSGALMPGISYSFAGSPKMEIKQVMTPLTDATDNVLAAPPNAQMWQFCKTYRRPFGESMPQPKAGNGGTDSEVVVRGIIARDGRIHDAVVQASERPEFNAEALDLIHQWVFTPALCNGEPNDTEAAFTLHFQGR
jgi:TonB family protein